MFYDCLFSTALQREYQPSPTPLRSERLGQWRGRGHLATAIKAFWDQSSGASPLTSCSSWEARGHFREGGPVPYSFQGY